MKKIKNVTNILPKEPTTNILKDSSKKLFKTKSSIALANAFKKAITRERKAKGNEKIELQEAILWIEYQRKMIKYNQNCS